MSHGTIILCDMSFLKLSKLSPSWVLNVTEILESLTTTNTTTTTTTTSTAAAAAVDDDSAAAPDLAASDSPAAFILGLGEGGQGRSSAGDARGQ